VAYLEKFLRIKKSKLPKAGKGLFTTVFIKKGKRIVEYKGKLVKWKEVEYEDPANGYLMYITAKAVIDARPSKTFGRYANDAGGNSKVKGLSNNAEYVSVGNKCYIEAIRAIEAGEEIFVDYGKDYWDLDKKTRRKEKGKKKKNS
jgi:SET domain-containing protein